MAINGKTHVEIEQFWKGKQAEVEVDFTKTKTCTRSIVLSLIRVMSRVHAHLPSHISSLSAPGTGRQGGERQRCSPDFAQPSFPQLVSIQNGVTPTQKQPM